MLMSQITKSLVFLFVSFGAGSIAIAGDFEKSVQEFQETATKYHNHQITLTEDEIRKLCVDIGGKAVAHLKLRHVRSRLHARRSEITVRIIRLGDSAFNRLASGVFKDARASIQYDLTFLFHHPFAAASFDRDLNRLRLSHESIVEVNADELSVNHELVHLNVWNDLRHKKAAIFR
jgi:hypothetical protein